MIMLPQETLDGLTRMKAALKKQDLEDLAEEMQCTPKVRRCMEMMFRSTIARALIIQLDPKANQVIREIATTFNITPDEANLYCPPNCDFVNASCVQGLPEL